MDVFISYSSGESILAGTIKHVLERAGAKAWFAEKSLMGGEKFPKEIMDAIMKCACMVVIVSKSSDASGQVENEIVNFKQKENAKIIPYMIDNKQEKTAFQLSTYHRINAAQDPYDKFDELITAVFEKDLPEEDETPKDVPLELRHEVENLNAIKPFKKGGW